MIEFRETDVKPWKIVNLVESFFAESMDLESESSALESFEDNSLMQLSANNIADNGRSLDNGSCSDESVKLVSNSTSVELDEAVSSGSAGGAHSPISKGQGLRKWRRIKRGLAKDTSANLEDTKVLKRGLSGLVHSHSKQMQFQSPHTEQDSQVSVGSMNMMRNTTNGFEILGTGYDPRFVAGVGFSAGMDSEKDDDRSSMSSMATKALKVITYEKPMISSGHRGKIRLENSKKHSGESDDIEKENSYSSLESDSRKQSGQVMDYNGENGDEADRNGVRPTRKDNVGGGREELIKKNKRFVEDLDPFTEAINDLLTLQEALGKEVQQFQKIERESMAQHRGEASEVSSPHSEIVTLLNSVEQLEIKLEETRSMLKMKESHIRELESTTNEKKYSRGDSGNRGTEIMVEDICRQKIEAEIEYLIYLRSVENLNIQMKVIKEQEAWAEDQADETMNKLGEVQMKAKKLTNRGQDLQKECIEITGTNKKRACKITSYFLIQLVLLLTLVVLFMSELLPESEIVVPT